MSAFDKFFNTDGSLKNFTPLNKSEKTQHFKRVKNRFKVSYNLSKTDGIITLSPCYSDEAPFDEDSKVFVSVEKNLIRVRCREFGYPDEYETKTWDRDQSKFKQPDRPRRITFLVPVACVGRYYRVEPVPAGFNFIFED